MQMAANSTGERFRQFNVVDDDDLTLAKYHATKAAVDKTVTHFFPGSPVLFAAAFTETANRVLPSAIRTRFTKHQVGRGLQDRWYDTSRIRQETGWSPKVPLEEALTRTWKAAL